MIYSIKEVVSAKISGEWGKEGTEISGVKVIRTANFVNDGTIDYEDVVFRNIVRNKVKQKKLHCGDIIIEKSGGSPNQPVGRVVFFDLKTYEPYLCNNFTTILRPNKNLIYPEYLFYHLFYLYQNHRTEKYQNKTTGIINLKLDDYLEEKLLVPSIEDQIQICSVLNKARDFVQKRQESLEQLNDFVNSVFYQLFGDPVKNNKEWYKETLGNIVEVEDGDRGPNYPKQPDLVNSGIPFFNTSNIKDNILNFQNLNFISQEVFNRLRKGKLKLSDLIITLRGSVGNVVVFDNPDFKTGFINAQMAILRVNPLKCNIIYLHQLLCNIRIQSLLKSMSSGSAQPQLPISQLIQLNLILPPLSLQNRFAEIVQKTQVIRQRFQESLEELNNLYQSLSQRAFQGKLDLSRLNVREELEKFQRKSEVSTGQSIENMLLMDSSTFYDTPQVRKRQERIEPVLPEAMKVRGPETKYGRFNIEQIAERIKVRYRGYHFSFEMLYRYLQKTLAEVPYYSSEELKKQPELNSEQDIRWFIQAAVINIERGENEKRLLNPFIQLKQHFYNAEEENMSLHIIKEDYELLRERNKKERSGIYFSIVES